MAVKSGGRQGLHGCGERLSIGLIVLCLLAISCAGDDGESSADADGQSTTTTTTTDEPTLPSTTPEDSEPDPDAQASVAIDCRRGQLLSELDADLSRVTFVPDDAPDDTTWIDIVITVENPTDERVAVDPTFEVSLIDEGGAEFASQPWVDETAAPVYADIVATEFIVQPDQTSTQRLIVFERYSGELFLRDSQTIALESLDRCELADEPDITPAAPYEPPPGVELDLADCAVTADLALVSAELTATNSSDDAVTLAVYAEVLDTTGDRLTTIATFEEPLSVAAGETVTQTLAGNAAHIDPSALSGCQLYFADFADE